MSIVPLDTLRQLQLGETIDFEIAELIASFPGPGDPKKWDQFRDWCAEHGLQVSATFRHSGSNSPIAGKGRVWRR